MTKLIDIDHEAGDLSEYSGTSTDGGDLSVTAGAALASTSYGLQCVIDDTNNLYGYVDLGTSSTTGKLRVRFYFDPNGITVGASESQLVVAYSSSYADILTVKLSYSSGYKIYILSANDSGYAQTSAYSITDAPHYIECYVTRATTSSSNDGTLQLWIDGTSKEQLTNLDNNGSFDNFDLFYVGATGVGAEVSGTYYLDQFIVNDDGGEIGPINPSISVTPAAVTCIAKTTAPTPILGSLTIAPAATACIASVSAPAVVLGAITFTPLAASCFASTVKPTVLGGASTTISKYFERHWFVYRR